MSWRPHDRLGLHHGRNLVELMRNLCCWGGVQGKKEWGRLVQQQKGIFPKKN